MRAWLFILVRFSINILFGKAGILRKYHVIGHLLVSLQEDAFCVIREPYYLSSQLPLI